MLESEMGWMVDPLDLDSETPSIDGAPWTPRSLPSQSLVVSAWLNRLIERDQVRGRGPTAVGSQPRTGLHYD